YPSSESCLAPHEIAVSRRRIHPPLPLEILINRGKRVQIARQSIRLPNPKHLIRLCVGLHEGGGVRRALGREKVVVLLDFGAGATVPGECAGGERGGFGL